MLFNIIPKVIPVIFKSNTFLFIVSSALFYLLKVKYDFLGDYNLRMMQVIKGEILYTEYLTMRFLEFFLFVFGKSGLNEHHLFVIYSCLMGGIYTVLARKVAWTLFDLKRFRYSLFTLLIFTPIILIFCGYIEVYSTPMVFMLWYCFMLVKTIKTPTSKNLILSLIVLLISIASHLLNVALIPSYLLLIIYANNNLRNAICGVQRWIIYVSAFAIVLIGFILALNSKSEFTLPLHGAPSVGYYGFLSFQHFWELMNGFFLAGGIIGIIYFVVIATRIFRMKLKLVESIFITAFLGPSLLLLVTNLQRGSADWDLMAYPFPLLFVSVIYFLYKHADWHKTLVNYILSTSIVFNIINTISWVYIQNGNRSIDKISDMLIGDPGTYYTKLHPKLQLAIIFDLNGLKQEAERMLIDHCDKETKDIKGCLMLLKNYLNKGDKEKSITLAERILIKDPFNPFVYSVLLDLYNNEDSYNYFVSTSRRMFDAFLRKRELFLNSYPKKRYIEIFNFLADIERTAGNNSKVKEIELQINMLDK